MHLRLLLTGFFIVALSSLLPAQTDYSRSKDTIFVKVDMNNPIEFTKGNHKHLYIENIIPKDIPLKQMKIQVISSKSQEIDAKQIGVEGLSLVMAVDLFEEKFYTLYIKKGDVTLYSKRILVR